jgi:photosystem II stability/assembly factor-like uncharacterized protein
MKKIIFYLCITSYLSMGFGGGCFFTPFETDNPLSALVSGFLYTNASSNAGFVDRYYIAAGENGKIYRSTDPLTDPWIEMVSNTSNRINYLADSDTYDTTLTYGVGEHGTIIRSNDQGMTWEVLGSETKNELNGIDFINLNVNTLVAVGNSGLIIRSSDGGESWNPVSSGVTKNLNSIYSLSSFANFIAGDDGTLLRSSDGGLTWENRSLADTVNDLNKIGTMGTWFFGTILGMVADSGKLYQSTDNLWWNPIETGTTEDLYEIKFKNASSGYVAGDNGTIRYTINGGNEWFSDFFLSSLTTERIRSTLIVNDTVAVGAAGNRINVISAGLSAQPVELSAFNFTVQNNDVNLHWTTSSEVNNSGFEIERKPVSEASEDAWRKIGFVNGHGTVSEAVNYDYSDIRLPSGQYNYRLKQIDFNGNFEYFSLTGDVVIGVPEKFELLQNYPNPFNPSTKLGFGISELGFVSLKIYDIQGREVAVIVNENLSPGSYEFEWNAKGFTSGVYFYKLQSGNYTETKKMLLTK